MLRTFIVAAVIVASLQNARAEDAPIFCGYMTSEEMSGLSANLLRVSTLPMLEAAIRLTELRIMIEKMASKPVRCVAASEEVQKKRCCLCN